MVATAPHSGDPNRVDIAVLGGGPAGAATALALRRHDPSWSVAIVEASDYRAARIGETLPPSTRRLLEHLGIWQAFLDAGHMPSHGTTAAWGSEEPHENEFIVHPDGEGWHLDRARFDALLAARAKTRGAQLWTGCTFINSDRHDGGWQLTLRQDGEQRIAQARFVVDATGRRAAFARRQNIGRIVCDRLLGLYAFFDLKEDTVLPATHTLVEAWEEGWWYSARLPDNRLVVACMSDDDRIAALDLRHRRPWLEALATTQQTCQILAYTGLDHDPTCHPAQSQLLESVVGDSWLAVGDAASTFDPLSSQGIFKALHFGIWAAYAISDHLQGQQNTQPQNDNQHQPDGLTRYARLVEANFDGYLTARREYYREEGRWPEAPFWRRRAGQIHLDPHLQLQSRDNERLSGQTQMSTSDVNRLCSLCREPSAAHEIVARFQHQRPGVASDHRIILVLQDLLTEGTLITATPNA